MSGSINLQKGQKIDLVKKDGSGLTNIFMGLGWDAAGSSGGGGVLKKLFGGNSGGGESIDLDASCVMLDENKKVIDTIYFGKLRSQDGSIVHTGDNLTGDGDGDDEVINVNLSKVASNVTTLVFTVNSFSGQNFNQVDNCFSRLVNKDTNEEFCVFKLAEKGSHTGLIMCKVYRHNGTWKIGALGTSTSGRTVSQIIPDILKVI